MRVLLIEDEAAHREKYAECAEFLPYPIELSMANGFKKAVKLIQSSAFDVIFLDFELHDGDGDGIMFLHKLRSMKIEPFPFIIAVTNNCSRKTHNVARELGADYIFTKVKPDYSPRLVFDFAHCFFSGRAKPSGGDLSDLSIEAVVTREVEKIGFTGDVIGKNYLIIAVLIIIHSNKSNISLKDDIYPVIAKKFKKSNESVEKAIRTAILKTWRITDIQTLQENYTANIDYGSGCPTNKQMILYIAEKVREKNAQAPSANGASGRAKYETTFLNLTL